MATERSAGLQTCCLGPAVWDHTIIWNPACLGPPLGPWVFVSFGTMGVWDPTIWDMVWDHRLGPCGCWGGRWVWGAPFAGGRSMCPGPVWDHTAWDHRLGPCMFGTTCLRPCMFVWDQGCLGPVFGTMQVFGRSMIGAHRLGPGVWNHGFLGPLPWVLGTHHHTCLGPAAWDQLFGTMGVWDHCLGLYRLGPCLGPPFGTIVWDHGCLGPTVSFGTTVWDHGCLGPKIWDCVFGTMVWDWGRLGP